MKYRSSQDYKNNLGIFYKTYSYRISSWLLNAEETDGITLSNNLSGLCSIKNKIKYWSPKIWPLALSKKLFVQKKSCFNAIYIYRLNFVKL